jgi:hypothetical protein
MKEEGKLNCKTMKLNCVNFVDAEGKEYHIHIPVERYVDAIDYSVKENWAELKKFIKWSESYIFWP